MKNQEPPHNSIEFLANTEEGHYFDRKSARMKPAEVARHIIAFANAAGGKLVIGIEDDGTVAGFKCDGAQRVEDFEQVPISLCLPTPIVSFSRIAATNTWGEEDIVLLFDIDASTNHVISRRTDNAVFLREGDASVKLDHNQIRALEYDKNQRTFEDEIVKGSSIDDIDEGEVTLYRQQVGSSVPTEQLLTSRSLMINGHLTVAGVILFGKLPTQLFPSARVRVLKIDGTKRESGARLNVVKDLTFEGPLPRVVRDAKETISHMLRDFYVLGKDGRFEEIPEYPEFAWFEGLINAVTHRDYSNNGEHIRISIYEDRLEILSPGKLPNMVTIENMRKTRHSRNPRIARTLADFGWVREFNEGVGRIYEAMQELSLSEPIFEERSKSVVVLTLENNIANRKHYGRSSVEKEDSEGFVTHLNDRELEVIRHLKAHGRITTKDLAATLGTSDKPARAILQSLTDKGMLEWHGSSPRDRSQYFALMEPSEETPKKLRRTPKNSEEDA